MKKENKILIVLSVILVGVFIISFGLGKYPINIKELFGILASKIIPLEQFWTDSQQIALFNVRMPRILLGVLVGAALPTAGVCYQGIFRNPMVSPDLLGASSGAAFGAVLAILRGAGFFGISMSAFFFALFTVWLVCVVGKHAKGSQVLGLVLSGIMISSLFTSATSFLKLVADPDQELPAITYWLMGSLAGAKKSDVVFAFIPILVGMIPLFLLRWKMNLLTLGDDEAKTMGVEVTKIRGIVIACATLITAASISVSGMIGWVGLVIPHFARMLIGCDYRKLLPASIIMGSAFMLIVDNIARLAATSEIPIGILTSFVGAPFFLYLIMREGEQ